MTDDRSNFAAWMKKKQKDDWQTPADVYEPIADAHDGIDLDPCAGVGTDIADRNIRPPQNGLVAAWDGTVFVNPPFSQIIPWLAKVVLEMQRDAVDRVYVVSAASPNTMSWWHRFIAEHATVTWFPYGRTEYKRPPGEEKNSKSGVSFDSALSVFGGMPPDDLVDEWTGTESGDLVLRPQNMGWSV